MVSPNLKQPKLLVSLSVYRPLKLPVSVIINCLVHFGLITVETDILEIFVQSQYPFLMIHNFASVNCFPFMIYNENGL